MSKKSALLTIPIYLLCFSLIISCTVFGIGGISLAEGMKQTNKDDNKSIAYNFQLYMARGKLSFAEGYFDTAIRNFKKAVDIRSTSSDAHDAYSQAIFFKKLGVLMESTGSG